MNRVGRALVASGLFLTGYLVGFFEMKYKITKVLAEKYIEQADKGAR